MDTIGRVSRFLAGLTVCAVLGFAENTYHFSNGFIFGYPDSWTRDATHPNVRLHPEGKKEGGLYLVTFAAGRTDPLDPGLQEFFEGGTRAAGLKITDGTEVVVLSEKTRSIRTWKMDLKGQDFTALLGVSIVPGGNAMALLVFDETAVFESRRAALISIVTSMAEEKKLFPNLALPPGFAQTPETRRKFLIWRMAREVTYAAIMKSMEQPWEEQYEKASGRAQALKVDLPPMPQFSGKKPGAHAAAFDYVLNKVGPALRAQLKGDGAWAAGLIEFGSKTMLLVHYQPGDSIGKSLASAVERSSQTAGLPDEIARPLLDAIQNKEAKRKVFDLVFDLDTSVAKHFSAVGMK